MRQDSPTLFERGAMKSLMHFWLLVLSELGTICDTSTSQDRKTALARFEHEGLSFLTITLPSFAADLQKGLELKKVDHALWKSFSFTRGLPRFLGGFLDLVFDRDSGVLLDCPSEDAIFAMRQLSLLFSKVELPCSDEREARAFKGYIECEEQLKSKEREWTGEDYAVFSRVASLLFREMFTNVDSDVYNGNVTPKHGPGATADRLTVNGRLNVSTWTDRLEKMFSMTDFTIPNARHFPLLDQMELLEPGDEIPVRVISVPKTLKTPRIIAIEPAHNMYVQQGILECFLKYWKRDYLLSQLIGFDDQVPNQFLAQEGSLEENLATLDLSEASDRVSNQLVRLMLDRFPHFAEGVDACRSRKADVPGNGVIRIAKFASMGSALCFPMEACVFLTCIFIGIERELNTQLTRKIVRSFLGKVRVFGDDIIVPKEYVSSVVEVLEHFGAKVNRDKSFWNGKFRESCGKEYYNGVDVSIVKVRRVFPTQRQHASEVLAMSSMRNQFYQLGLWKTCAWLDDYLVRLLGRYPMVAPTSPVIGRHSIFGYECDQGYSDLLHKPLVKGYVVSSRPPIDRIDGEFALLKFFLKRGSTPFQEGHLERAGRPDAVNIKLRWASPY